MTEQRDGRETGEVKWFNNTKGYGFIVCDDRPELGDLFAHFSAIEMEGYKTLKAGQRVSFVVAEGPKGMHAAAILGDEASDVSSEIDAQPASAELASAAVDGIDVELPSDAASDVRINDTVNDVAEDPSQETRRQSH